MHKKITDMKYMVMGSTPRKQLERSLATGDYDQVSSISSSAEIDIYTPEVINEEENVLKKRQTATSTKCSDGHLFLLRNRSRTYKEQSIKQNEILKDVAKEEILVSKWKTILLNLYPYWFLNNIHSWEKFKVAFRTWVAIWLSLLFVLIHPSHVWMQNASFLTMVIVMIYPPGTLSVFEAILSSISILFGVVVGWLHSVIAMAISDRLRKVKFNSQDDFVIHLIELGICKNDPDTIEVCIQRYIFKGNYLEAKSTIIFAFAMGFGILLFFMIRMNNPLRTPVCIIATISTIISCTFTNLFPFFTGVVTIGNVIFRPVGLALAINVVTSVFIFPTTSLYKYLNYSKSQMNLIQKYSVDHIKMMKEVYPCHEKFGDFSSLHEIMTSIRALFFPIFLQSHTIGKELCYMRLSPTDISVLNERITKLGNSLAGIEYFYMNLHECKKWIDFDSSDISGLEKIVTNIASDRIANYERLKTADAYRSFFTDQLDSSTHIKNVDDLNYIMEVINDIFSESFETAHKTIKNCTEWLELTNNFRLSRFWPGSKKKYLERNREIRESIVKDKELLLKQSESMIEEIERICRRKQKESITLPMIGQVSLFEHIFKQYVQAVDALCDDIIKWDETKPKPTIHLPFVYLFDDWKKKLSNESELEDENVRIRNPDAVPFDTFTGKMLNKSVTAYNYLMKESHLPLGVRTSLVTVLCSFMAFFPSSLFWYFENKVIWVPIMVSISVSSDSYDSVYQILGKVGSTLIGSICAGFAWYISTGSGHGNAYGLGAVCGVLFFFMSFYRHFSVHITPMPAIVPAVTIVLIIGTSWQDAKIPMAASMHWGLRPAYSRFIEVTIGCVIAFLVSIFPHVSTGSKKVRVTISDVLRNIARIHCQMRDVLIFRYKEFDERKLKTKETKAIKLIRSNLLELTKAMKVIKHMKYEPTLLGKWPKKKYDTLIIFEIHILKLYSLLLTSFNMIKEPKFWVEHISSRLGCTDDNLTSDFFAVIYMCSASLKEGVSLPRVTPSELSLKHLEILTQLGLGDPFYGSDGIFFNDLANSSDNEDVGNYDVNLKMLLSKEGRCNMVSLIIMHLIFEKIDLILVLIKSLVGEEFNFEDHNF